MSTATPSLSQLQRALAIAEQIQKLEEELKAVMAGGHVSGGKSASPVATPQPTKRGPGRPPKVASAVKAPAIQTPGKRGPGRPPKSKAATGAATVTSLKAPKAGKRTMSPEVRAKLAAAMKARWAAAKKKGLPGPNARK
jgi:hypothetical protein